MDYENAEDWKQSFTDFFSHFESLFKRSESRSVARHYMRGLLADVSPLHCHDFKVNFLFGLIPPHRFPLSTILTRNTSVSAAIFHFN